MKLIRTDPVEAGYESKSKKPYAFNEIYDIKTFNSFIRYNSGSKYYRYKFVNGDWVKCRYYFVLEFNKYYYTFTTKNVLCDIFLYLKFETKLTNIMAWIGGILSMILTVKNIFY